VSLCVYVSVCVCMCACVHLCSVYAFLCEGSLVWWFGLVSMLLVHVQA